MRAGKARRRADGQEGRRADGQTGRRADGRRAEAGISPRCFCSCPSGPSLGEKVRGESRSGGFGRVLGAHKDGHVAVRVPVLTQELVRFADVLKGENARQAWTDLAIDDQLVGGGGFFTVGKV